MSCPGAEKALPSKRERGSSEALNSDLEQQPDATRKEVHPEGYESTYVHDVYEVIAPHFSATRYRAWPRVHQFLASLPPYTMVADVGCGNGKYFASGQQLAAASPFSSGSQDEDRDDAKASARSNTATKGAFLRGTRRYMVGVDYSTALLRQARREMADPNAALAQVESPSQSASPGRVKKRPPAGWTERQPRTDSLRADARRCPFRCGLFDAVMSIAVVHHYVTHQRRREAVQELLRLARPGGGLVLIYVWAMASDGKKREVDARTGDALVAWEMNTRFRAAEGGEQRVFHRFYHFFVEGELEQLCVEAAKEAGVEVHVRETYYDKENWCILLERDQ